MVSSVVLLKLIIGIQIVYGNVGKDSLRDSTLIDTDAGPIRGVRAEDGNYTMFLGIPYAVVNEENPFGLNSPHPIFTEPFEAIHNSVACPQSNMGRAMGQIDCLQLNIYVPDTPSSDTSMPVLIWVHGGRFQFGFASNYHPKFLVQHDVIVVTINYRTGIYGFMCLNTPEIPGNQGLKDQLAAVKWIKQNIKYFGGDPGNLVAFGQSAGGMALHFHMLSPHEEYFSKYILHSGTAFNLELVQDPNPEAAIRIAATLGLNTIDVNTAIAHLAAQHPHSVVSAASSTGHEFWLCTEPENIQDRFLIDFPINLDNIPKAKGKSVLLGITDDEAMLHYANRPAAEFETFPMMHNSLRDFFTFPPEQLARTERIFRNFYFRGRPQSVELRAEMANFHSDIIFVYPTHRAVESLLKNEVDEIFLFKFSYIGERNQIRVGNNINIGGAVHTDELGYLFDFAHLPENITYEDQIMLDRMTTMWTNFAKYGDPTPETNTLLPVKWEPITTAGTPHNFLKLDEELEMDFNFFNERVSFWDMFIDGHIEYQRGYRVENSATCFNVSIVIYLPMVLMLVLVK